MDLLSPTAASPPRNEEPSPEDEGLPSHSSPDAPPPRCALRDIGASGAHGEEAADDDAQCCSQATQPLPSPLLSDEGGASGSDNESWRADAMAAPTQADAPELPEPSPPVRPAPLEAPLEAPPEAPATRPHRPTANGPPAPPRRRTRRHGTDGRDRGPVSAGRTRGSESRAATTPPGSYM